MTRYTATIRHHSIASARTIDAGDTLAAAKRAATREFGTEMLDAMIVVMDRDAPSIYGNPMIVANRRVGDRNWGAA